MPILFFHPPWENQAIQFPHAQQLYSTFLVNIDIFGVRKWEATSENLDVSPHPGSPPMTWSALIALFQLFVSVLSRVI